MSNTKALTPGTWCKPKDEKEWRAVLDLAKSLGLAVNDKGVTGYTICPMVWSIGYDGASRGLISMRTEPPGGNGSNLSDHPTPVPDFIAAMYALAEERKGETAKCGCPADDYISGPVHMQRLTQELRPVFASQGDMLRAFKRLTKLEQALNDHMVKEREKELAGARAQKFWRELGGNPLISQDEVNAQIDRIFSIKSVSKGDDHVLGINPKASPKDIPFSVALEYAKMGRYIKRDIWEGFLVQKDGAFFTQRGAPYNISSDCIMENDWMVLPERK